MARRESVTDGEVTRFREAIVERRREHLSYWGGPDAAEKLAAFTKYVMDGNEIEFDSLSLWASLDRFDPRAAKQFVFRSDPKNVRRFKLTTDNHLIEIDHKE